MNNDEIWLYKKGQNGGKKSKGISTLTIMKNSNYDVKTKLTITKEEEDSNNA